MILVFGSINVDVLVPVPQLPQPGETVLGGDYALLAETGKKLFHDRSPRLVQSAPIGVPTFWKKLSSEGTSTIP